MSLIPPNIGTVRPTATVEENVLAAEYRKTVVEIQSELFDKASAYSNLIMVGGYAGTFTVWANTRSQLPAKANILIALLLGVSLAVFVCYQVYKMATHVRHFRRVRVLLRDGLPLNEFFEKYNELDREARKLTLQSGVMVSTLWFVLCVAPAVLALADLFYNFAASLIDLPMWPR
jgi:hypothetical protein